MAMAAAAAPRRADFLFSFSYIIQIYIDEAGPAGFKPVYRRVCILYVSSILFVVRVVCVPTFRGERFLQRCPI